MKKSDELSSAAASATGTAVGLSTLEDHMERFGVDIHNDEIESSDGSNFDISGLEARLLKSMRNVSAIGNVNDDSDDSSSRLSDDVGYWLAEDRFP